MQLKITLLTLLLSTFLFSSSTNNIKNMILNLKKQIRNGDTNANFKLGVIYYKKRNLDLAMLYFTRAADYDNKKAKYNIAIIYGNKNFRSYNPKQAFKLYKELAQQDYDKAQIKVALALLHGIGVEKDYQMARQWLERAYFKHNNLEAGCYLAYIYTYGRGVLVNLGRARKLALKGYNKKIHYCRKIYNNFNLYKYKQDKGFKFGYYSNF